MSTIGYYRYKLASLSEGTRTVNFYVNGGLASTKTIVVKKICTNGKLLKYLDSSGQYRFFPFNDRWESSDKPSILGTTNDFIASILTAQSNRRNVGYKNDRIMALTADVVSNDELEILSEIYTSPDVYLYVGSTTDEEKDWVRVTVKSKSNTVRRRKGNYNKVDLDIILPEWFTVKLI